MENNIMLRDDKNIIITMIQALRTQVNELVYDSNEDKIWKVQKNIDKIQDKVFNL